MKTARLLVFVAGALNALFFLFHLRLGWNLWHSPLPAQLRALLATLNAGGAFAVLFLAVAALAFAGDLLATLLGRTVLALGATLYLVRAAAEAAIVPQPQPAILAACVVTGALHLTALLLASRRPGDTALPPAPLHHPL